MNALFQIRKIMLYLFFLMLLQKCTGDAPRENPLDPKSKIYSDTGYIRGQVFNFYAPFTPLGNAKIRVDSPLIIAVNTSNDGAFEISDLPSGQYQLIADKTGYASDSLIATVAPRNATDITFHLNALPVAQTFSVTSIHISEWAPVRDVYRLFIKATVTDLDGVGDIDSVTVWIPRLSFETIAEPTNSTGVYETTINESDLPGKNIQFLVGQDIFLRIKDQAGASIQSLPGRLSRIISTTPAPNSPVGRAIVTEPNPTLKWRHSPPAFAFSYRVNVFRYEANDVADIWQSNNISASDTSVTVSYNFIEGDYGWTVSIFDDFGNISRSKPAAFRIMK